MTDATAPTQMEPEDDDFDPYSDDSDLPDTLLGQTLHDTYLIKRVVGEGGMGRVYEAHHTRIEGKRFAVKVLRADMMHSPEVRTRFQREAQAAASIHHPNVIGVHDYGHTPDGRPYLVAEFLEGLDLRAHVEKVGILDVETAVFIARRVCDAIQAAHVHGVIHRDLKPENIYLMGPLDRPLVKVLDFGLSRFMEPGPSSSVTRTGIVMGTPSYMAPEQARGERVDHRVDVYGVGVLLYVALTGKPPFSEESPQQTVLAVLSQSPVRPRVHNPAVPEALEVVIERAMAREVADRYPSAADLDGALARFDTLERRLGGRPQLPSRMGIGSDEVELGSARTELTLLLAFATALTSLGLVTVVVGLPSLFGWRSLKPLELGLVLTAIAGTVLTPLVLAVRWLGRRVWSSSVRTVELVPALRAPLVAGAAAVGTAALAGYAVDAVASALGAGSLVTGIAGALAWGPLLVGLGLTAVATVTLRRWCLGGEPTFLRRLAAGPLVLGLGAVAVVALVQAGLVAQGKRSVPAAPSERVEEPTVRAAPPPPSAAPVAVAVAAPAASVASASALELEAARAGGLASLEALGAKYSDDPPVLEALALARSRDPARQLETLATLERLFTTDPARSAKRELADVVLRIALARGEGAGRSLELMGRHMGSTGADLLYDIYVTSNELRVAARERLDQPGVQAAMSPALSVSYALRVAKTCEDRLPLLKRAASDGDERTIAALRGFTVRPKRGCGWKKSQPCPAACPLEAMRFERAAADIQAGLTAAAAARAR